MSKIYSKSDLLKNEILVGTGSCLTVDDCHLIAKGNIEILLAPKSRNKMGESYRKCLKKEKQFMV